jgi:hypothetical protein
MQSYLRQPHSQSLQLMTTISPQAKSVEQLIVDAFDDLADGGYPPPEPLGPVLFGVSFWAGS